MGWLHNGLLALSLVSQPPVAPPSSHQMAPDGVSADCDDFVKVTDDVFTGRTGAMFGAGGVRDDLSGDTFGPQALAIGGVDPAIYLQQKCTPKP